MSSQLDELRALALPRAPQCGSNRLAIPGALIYRADAPETFAKRSASTLSVGVVLQGRKEVRIDRDVLCYDEAHCIVLTGEVDYESRVLEAAASPRPWRSSASIPIADSPSSSWPSAQR